MRRRLHDHVVGDAEFGQIGAGAERRVLARADDDAADVALSEPSAEHAKFMNRGVREDVHRPARRIENQMDETVVLEFEAKLLELRRL